jgi:hypothetical protein
VKWQLDRIRSLKTPTIPNHHLLRIVNSLAVEEAEAELARDPGRGEELSRRLREDLIYKHFRPGDRVLVRHIKVGQGNIELRGEIRECGSASLLLLRHFREGGLYDGLDLPKKEGDWGTVSLSEGEWVTVRRYYRRDNTPIGEVYNIGTPVEFYPEQLRYVDLELDVVRLPGGAPRLVDQEVLERKVSQGLLPLSLAQEARRIATELMESLGSQRA